MRLVVPLLSLLVAVQAKRTYRLEQTPVLKAPRVQKYDCRNCAFDDTLNYACIEHSIDVKVGWEIKQKWELASDIIPPDTYIDGDSAYKPDNAASDFTDVRYKYTWKIIPYSVISFNVRPNAKLDRIF